MTYPTSQASKDADTQEERSYYVAFETRLVPISEAPKESEQVISVGPKGETLTIWYDQYYDMWTMQDHMPIGSRGMTFKGTDLGFEPTHFLQFKINGGWTHEFNLNKKETK